MFNVIVAACEGSLGIGQNGTLPWRLRNEMKHFAHMTKATRDPDKRNSVIMGRKTYESIPEKFRPLRDRLNIVLTRQTNYDPGADNVIVARSMEETVKLLEDRGVELGLESHWIIGGAAIYKYVLSSPLCDKLFLTLIEREFPCDTFLDSFDAEKFVEIEDEAVDRHVQEENGIKYRYKVYKKLRV